MNQQEEHMKSMDERKQEYVAKNNFVTQEEFAEQVYRAMEDMGPTLEQKNRIREQINNMAEEGKKYKRFHWLYTARNIGVAVATVALFLFVGNVSVRVARAEGNESVMVKIVDAIKEICGIEESTSDIIRDMVELPQTGIGAYAPQIFACNEDYLIYGDNRGLVIYDFTKEMITATVDLQSIGCHYFDSQTKNTVVAVQDDKLAIYNTENGIPSGMVYEYWLNDFNQNKELDTKEQETFHIAALEPNQTYSVEEKETPMNTSKYTDTFQAFEPVYFINSDDMYSQNAIYWTDADGKEQLSCLVIEQDAKRANTDIEYVLYTKNCTTNEDMAKKLNILTNQDVVQAVETSKQKNELPAYTYNGNDAMIKAVSDYVISSESQWYETTISEGSIFVPSPLIYQVIEEGDETIVFGNFWYFLYARSGNTLTTQGGGEMPARIRLAKTTDGYEVVEVKRAGDGADYDKDIKAFCKGYHGAYENFVGYDWEAREKDKVNARKDVLASYVQENDLDISYYQDYGQDPISLK